MSDSLFQRTPRQFRTPPTGKLEVAPPPPAPPRPTSSLITVLLPGLFTLLGLGLSVAFVATQPAFLLLSLPMMLGSALAGLIGYSSERTKYRRAVEEREQQYRRYLDQVRHQLEQWATEQRQIALEANPDFGECLARASRQSPEKAARLWERSSGLERPRDPDFFHLRLGSGAIPPTFSVQLPARPPVGEEDPLYTEAARLIQAYQRVQAVPVLLPLADLGSAGLIGSRPAVLGLARSLLVQMTTHHAPGEVCLVAFLPQHELEAWCWIRWLPHIWDDERQRRFIATTPQEAQALARELFPLLQRRSLAAQEQDKDASPVYGQTYLFLIADAGLLAGQDPLLALLLSQGPAIGAYSLILTEPLPGACRAVVDLRGAQGILRLIGPPAQEVVFTPDQVEVYQADRFARTLAPVRLKRLATQAELPSSLSLSALLQVGRLESYPVLQHWQQRDSFQRLEVPLGVEAGGGGTYLNFQETARGGDGSHAMVGGTTGTGKTRFLQTLITLLAAHHHPHDVNLVLIDYKGGDLLQGLEDLPHVVGALANLEKQDAQAVLVERLFVCLEAELRRRRNLLGGKDINAYQQGFLQGKQTDPLPHLFVIIDEFAEMIRNSPDKAAMTKRLLSIGATGRSLGVHLILATQDPSGVVTDELRNNINVRICLRMGSRDASMALLRLPDAFEKITSAQVGRAYLQVGNNDRFVMFQVAWGGDRYVPTQSSSSNEIYQVDLSGRRTPLRGFRPLQVGNETQLGALVRHIRETAIAAGLQRLKSPLSPPLRSQIFLDELRQGEVGWDGNGWAVPAGVPRLSPIVGQMDDPANQAQEPLRLPLGTQGHFALFGEPGSGKTTFVQTLVTSLACSHTPAQVHLYLIDMSSQRLAFLKGFPHVGAVFLGDETDRLRRFLRYLERELRSRKEAFARVGAAGLQDYGTLTGRPLPAIVTILEDYAAFFKTCQTQNLDLDDRLADLVRDGSSYGLYFVLTTANPADLRPRLAASIPQAATYHLATRDYSMAVGPTGGMEPAPLPGRGLIKGPLLLEFQTALPVRGDAEPARVQALKSLMEQMDRAWQGPRPPSFPPIPEKIGLSQILFPADRWPELSPAGLVASFALNLEDPDQPFEVDLRSGPYFLVAGTPQCGKTTLLQAWVLALADRYPVSRLLLYLVDFHQGGLLELSDLPHVRAGFYSQQDQPTERSTGYITDAERLAQALTEIEAILQKRQVVLEETRQRLRGTFRLKAWLDEQPTLLMVMDDFETVEADAYPETKELLNANLRKWQELGLALIVAGSISAMENAWGWIGRLRAAPIGFQMGSAAYNQIFKMNLATGPSGRPPAPGDAFFIARGQATPVRVASPHLGPVTLGEWVEKIKKRPA